MYSSRSNNKNSDKGYSLDNSDFISRVIIEAKAKGRRSNV